MKSLLFFMSVLALLASSSCSTLKIDKDRVNQSRKVAVVGFCVHQQVPKTLMDNLLGSRDSGSMPNAEFCSEKPHAATMYGDFVNHLKSEFKFQVLDQKTLTENAAYQELFKRFTVGWQSRPPSRGAQIDCYRPNGILDPYPIHNLSMEERAQLMTALGVDRIAVAEVNTSIENTNFLKGMVGAADLSTEAYVSFQMYADEKAPIWSDTYAKGKASKDTVGSVLGIQKQDALNAQTAAVSKTAYQALSTRAKQ